jgi:hypothetical protein
MSILYPDGFQGDPYGHTTNQTSHAFLVGGILLAYLPVLVWWMAFGEFPEKWLIIGWASVAYAAFELLAQGWRGWDTVEDWIFVVIHGTTGFVVTLNEVEPGSTAFTGDLIVAGPFLILFLLHLAAGAWFRKLVGAKPRQ